MVVVEVSHISVVRVVRVEPCLCFGLRSEITTVLGVSRIPRWCRGRRGGALSTLVCSLNNYSVSFAS